METRNPQLNELQHELMNSLLCFQATQRNARARQAAESPLPTQMLQQCEHQRPAASAEREPLDREANPLHRAGPINYIR